MEKLSHDCCKSIEVYDENACVDDILEWFKEKVKDYQISDELYEIHISDFLKDTSDNDVEWFIRETIEDYRNKVDEDELEEISNDLWDIERLLTFAKDATEHVDQYEWIAWLRQSNLDDFEDSYDSDLWKAGKRIHSRFYVNLYAMQILSKKLKVEKIQQKAEELGVLVDFDENDIIDLEHLDVTWYYDRGCVASITKEVQNVRYELLIISNGEIDIYGAINWYDWSCEYWGTKWNAYDQYIDGNVIYFDTAWACPFPILDALAELCRKYNVRFEGKWADEDMGCNTGTFSSNCKGCECSCDSCYAEDCSSAAYDIYVECKGTSHCLGKDEQGNWVAYDCEICPHPC